MSWNRLEILLLLTLIIGIASSSPINNSNESATSLSKKNISSETSNLLSNLTEFETMELRTAHMDEDSPKTLNDDSDAEIIDTDLKYEVEILQPGKLEQEDIEIEERFKGPSLNFETNEFYDEDIEVSSQAIQEGHLIVTVALFVLAFVAIGIYAGLVIWRSNLEKRYGMRQRLMTDDDFCANIDDTRPF